MIFVGNMREFSVKFPKYSEQYLPYCMPQSRIHAEVSSDNFTVIFASTGTRTHATVPHPHTSPLVMSQILIIVQEGAHLTVHSPQLTVPVLQRAITCVAEKNSTLSL